MIYLEIFFEFFVTGLFMFGGGLASIPFLQQMTVTTDWFSMEELLNMIAISESTPGPIAVNIATYSGFMAAGIVGGIIATISLLLPSVTIAIIVAKLLARFRKNPLVDAAFYGLRPASLGLITAAGMTLVQYTLFDIQSFQQAGFFTEIINFRAVAMAVVLFVLMSKVKAHPVLFLAASAIVGIIIF